MVVTYTRIPIVQNLLLSFTLSPRWAISHNSHYHHVLNLLRIGRRQQWQLPCQVGEVKTRATYLEARAWQCHAHVWPSQVLDTFQAKLSWTCRWEHEPRRPTCCCSSIALLCTWEWPPPSELPRKSSWTCRWWWCIWFNGGCGICRVCITLTRWARIEERVYHRECWQCMMFYFIFVLDIELSCL